MVTDPSRCSEKPTKKKTRKLRRNKGRRWRSEWVGGPSPVPPQVRLDDVETHSRDEGRLLERGVHLSNTYAGLRRRDSAGGVQTSFLTDRLGSCSV